MRLSYVVSKLRPRRQWLTWLRERMSPLLIGAGLLAYVAYRLIVSATPGVPVLKEGGQLTLLTEGCSRADYDMFFDLDRVTEEGATLRIDMTADCDYDGAKTVRWAVAMVGPVSSATEAAAGSIDPRNPTPMRPVSIEQLKEVTVYTYTSPSAPREEPVMVVAGINETDIVGVLHVRVLITGTSMGQQDGSYLAIAAPSVDAQIGFLPGEPLYVSFDEATDASDLATEGPSDRVALNTAKTDSVSLDAGQLDTAQSLEFVSSPLTDPGFLRWELTEGRELSARILDNNLRQGEERSLFAAGVLAGIAGSLLVEGLLRTRGGSA
jgi:hypothetical protein